MLQAVYIYSVRTGLHVSAKIEEPTLSSTTEIQKNGREGTGFYNYISGLRLQKA
jgi:hypothetical protein